MEILVIIIFFLILVLLISFNNKTSQLIYKVPPETEERLTGLVHENLSLKEKYTELSLQNQELVVKLEQQVLETQKVLSQKKSSETKIGAISENLIPLIQGLPYDASNLHHLARPIDYLYYDYDNAEIIFIEVKSGNSKESTRQKLIKNMICKGKVFYEELRVNENGIKIKRATNE